MGDEVPWTSKTPEAGRRHLATDRRRLAADKLTQEKNADAYAELCLSLDDCSLSLIIREKNDGRKSLKILCKHYLSSSERRVIGLYTELTTLKKELKKTPRR